MHKNQSTNKRSTETKAKLLINSASTPQSQLQASTSKNQSSNLPRLPNLKESCKTQVHSKVLQLPVLNSNDQRAKEPPSHRTVQALPG